jgi:hypothetical protein
MEAQAILARPVEDTLFFPGEATELAGHQATVHGAPPTRSPQLALSTYPPPNSRN